MEYALVKLLEEGVVFSASGGRIQVEKKEMR